MRPAPAGTRSGEANQKASNELNVVELLVLGITALLACMVAALSIYRTGLAHGHLAAVRIEQGQQRSATFGFFSGPWTQPMGPVKLVPHPPPNVLVMYVYSDTNIEYTNNLKYFLREGLRDAGNVTFIVVVNSQSIEDYVQGTKLPDLPPNARYVYHNNTCYDWGTFGWVLETQEVDVRKYAYFIFLNSSVRGPFLPVYLRGRVHWINILLSRLSDEVKLVGPTVNCQPSPLVDERKLYQRRLNPHVQSYTVATDSVGMQIMMNTKEVFECYPSLWDTIYYSELGSSLAIINAGYNLGSLLVRYQGVDWRDNSTWNCNRNANPTVPNAFDGSSPEAMETMFVKVKARQLHYRVTNMEAAMNYDRWQQVLQQENYTEDIQSNVFVDYPESMAAYKAPLALMLARRGMGCFDCNYYMSENPDLPRDWPSTHPCKQAFEHYINSGQFELRAARYTCDWEPSTFLPVT